MEINPNKLIQWSKFINATEPHREQWKKFSLLVEQHIYSYAIQQYGDSHDNQQWIDLNEKDCLEAIRKYRDRIPSRARGMEEAVRDCFKIAHYAQRLFVELCNEALEEKIKIEEKNNHEK